MEEQKEHHMVLIAIIAIVAVVAIIAVVIALTSSQSRQDVAGQGLSLDYCILFDHVCDQEDCYDANGHHIACPGGTAEDCHKQVYENCYCRLINCKKSAVN